jgi:hypothetical protein
VPVLTSFSPPACFLQRRPSSGSASDAGSHPRSSTAVTRWSGPDRLPSERSPGLPSSPSAPRHEVPGFGAVCSPVRFRAWDGRAGAAAGLRSSARADRRVARLLSPSEPARGEPVGSPRRLLLSSRSWRVRVPKHSPSSPFSCLKRRRGRFRRGRENVESGQTQGGLSGDSRRPRPASEAKISQVKLSVVLEGETAAVPTSIRGRRFHPYPSSVGPSSKVGVDEAGHSGPRVSARVLVCGERAIEE